ncbi:MAG TPA: polysaccharide biosynthesis tyrosine autokinase [Terriglobales bacterium]|nr:polysaccharide biosynthesis tyrosine autokinase [Terriglobales bacterium]
MNSRNLLGATSELTAAGSEILDRAQPAVDLQLANDSQQFFLLDYLRVLVKRRWVILGSLAFGLAAAVIVSLHTTPLYRAEGQITISKENPNPLGFKSATSEDASSSADVDLATQARILQSSSLAMQALRKLQPNDDLTSTANGIDVNSSVSLTGPPQPVKSQQGQLARRFESGLTVAVIPDTRIINISYISPNPSAAADAVNALINTYIEQNLKTHFESTSQAADWLTKQLSDLQIKVEISEEKLVRYQKEHGIVGTDEKQNIITSKLTDLNSQLTSAEADRIQKQAVYQLTLSGDPEAISTVSQDSFLQSLRGQEAELKNQLAQATVQLGSAYPKVIELKNRILQVEDTIKAELKRTTSRVHNDYVGALEREQMLRQAFEQQKEDASQLNQNAIEYNLLKRDADSNRQLYDSLMQRLKEASLSAGLSSTNVHIVDVASAPPAPFTPDIPRNLGIGLLIGLTTGLALAFVFEALDTTVRTPDQAEAIALLPSLGLVPLVSNELPHAKDKHRLPLPELQNGHATAVLAYTRPHSHIAEAYRALRTSILLSMPDAPPKLILVTSPSPQDGKTTTSVNAAIVLAQEGRSVLLVDADLRRPSISKALGVAPTSGLTTVLVGNAFPESVILPSPELPNLFLVTSGPKSPCPSELLSSAHMIRLLARWREMFDHVIIDSAPVLAVTDAVRLSSHADAVLLVIRAAQTNKAALRQASMLLAQVKANVLGILVNALDMRSPDQYYYSYWGTNAKGYYDADETEDESA